MSIYDDTLFDETAADRIVSEILNRNNQRRLYNMGVLFKDENGNVQQVVESREIKRDWLDQQIEEAEKQLQSLKDLRDQFDELHVDEKEVVEGEVVDAPVADEPAPAPTEPDQATAAPVAPQQPEPVQITVNEASVSAPAPQPEQPINPAPIALQ